MGRLSLCPYKRILVRKRRKRWVRGRAEQNSRRHKISNSRW